MRFSPGRTGQNLKISPGIGSDADVVEFVVGEKRIPLFNNMAHAAVTFLLIEE